MRYACVLAVIAGCGFAPGSAPSDASRGASGDASADGNSDASTDGGIDAAPDAGMSPTSPRKLVFSNPTSTNLDNFPVLVALDASRIDYSQVIDPLRDLRFVDGGTTNTLKHEVEFWNPGGHSVVWVQVPRIDAGTQTDFILMHWGASENVQQDAPTVWGLYELVIHLGGSLNNSRGGNYDATTNAGASGGIIGGGTRFDAANQSMAFVNGTGLFDAWGELTIEYWVRLDYNNVGELSGQPAILGKQTSVRSGRAVNMIGQPTHLLDFQFASGTQVGAPVSVPLKVWTHIAWTYASGSIRGYRDGQLAVQIGAVTGNLAGDQTQFVVGHATNAFRGDLDELRIARQAFPESYLRAQHASMTDQMITFTDP